MIDVGSFSVGFYKRDPLNIYIKCTFVTRLTVVNSINNIEKLCEEKEGKLYNYTNDGCQCEMRVVVILFTNWHDITKQLWVLGI